MKKIFLALILMATICGCREAPQPTPKPIPPKDDDKEIVIIKDDGKITPPPVIYSEK